MAELRNITVCDPDAPDAARFIIPVASVEQLMHSVHQVFRQPGFLSFRRSDGVRVHINPSAEFKKLPSELVWTHRLQDAQAATAGGGATGAAKMVRRSMLAPSEFSRYNVKHAAQEEARQPDALLLMPFLDYRPLGCEPPMSVALVHPALAEISEAFMGKEQHGPPFCAELSTVAKLICMADQFATKGRRRDAFLHILNEYLGREGWLAVNAISAGALAADDDDWIQTDGTILSEGIDSMPIVILQVKNEVGESGDPGPQGQDFYRRYLMDRAHKPDTAATVYGTPCPCLLLELMGPELRVSALASTCDIQVICQPLTPRLHLYDMFHTDWKHMVVVAKALRAFKFGVRVLRECYASVGGASNARPAKRLRPSATPGKQQPLDRDPSLLLPYPLRPGSGSVVSRKLPEPLFPLQAGCLLYSFWPPGDTRSRLVKFVRHGIYGEAVHRAWAEQGLAPELYDVEQLPGGFCMVQMEELLFEEGTEGWRSVAEIPVEERTPQLYAAVKGALHKAHAVEISAGKHGVHGDARAANVLVKLPAAAGGPPPVQEQGASGGGATPPELHRPSQGRVDVAQQQGPAETEMEVRFVDFDWAGVADEAELPPWAVPRRGLRSDRKLTKDYDLAVLDETWTLDSTTGVHQGASARC